MSDSSTRRHSASVDIVTGVVLTLAGLTASYAALDFDAESRLFPALAAGLLALTGVAILVLGVVHPGDPRRVAHSLGLAALAVTAIGGWAGLFAAGLGFVLPTFLLQFALLWLAGERRVLFSLAVAAIVTGLAYLAFAVVLDVPMPPSVWPAGFEAP